MSVNLMRPSTLHLPKGSWATVLDCLCDHFPAITREVWLERFTRGRVLDANHEPLAVDHPFKEGLKVHYFREVSNEVVIPFTETIVFENDHLLVADKPHFLPTIPSGKYVEQTLLARLIRRTGNLNLAAIHRLDRLTAGLVLFSKQPENRDRYQKMFRERTVQKYYECLAPAVPHLTFPYVHQSRLEKSEPFFTMREVEGEPNSETHIDVIEKMGDVWRYDLKPITGKQHQLRVHMNSLGAPILNDDFYPVVRGFAEMDDYVKPLKLLAKKIEFVDPVDGVFREFNSQLNLGYKQ